MLGKGATAAESPPVPALQGHSDSRPQRVKPLKSAPCIVWEKNIVTSPCHHLFKAVTRLKLCGCEECRIFSTLYDTDKSGGFCVQTKATFPARLSPSALPEALPSPADDITAVTSGAGWHIGGVGWGGPGHCKPQDCSCPPLSSRHKFWLTRADGHTKSTGRRDQPMGYNMSPFAAAGKYQASQVHLCWPTFRIGPSISFVFLD